MDEIFQRRTAYLANQRQEGCICQGTAAEDEQNAGKTRAIGNARPSTLRSTWWSWQERFDQIPQRIGKQRRSHTRPRFVADEDQVSAVLLHALTF